VGARLCQSRRSREMERVSGTSRTPFSFELPLSAYLAGPFCGGQPGSRLDFQRVLIGLPWCPAHRGRRLHRTVPGSFPTSLLPWVPVRTEIREASMPFSFTQVVLRVDPTLCPRVSACSRSKPLRPPPPRLHPPAVGGSERHHPGKLRLVVRPAPDAACPAQR